MANLSFLGSCLRNASRWSPWRTPFPSLGSYLVHDPRWPPRLSHLRWDDIPPFGFWIHVCLGEASRPSTPTLVSLIVMVLLVRLVLLERVLFLVTASPFTIAMVSRDALSSFGSCLKHDSRWLLSSNHASCIIRDVSLVWFLLSSHFVFWNGEDPPGGMVPPSISLCVLIRRRPPWV